jgi:hypothetical protein
MADRTEHPSSAQSELDQAHRAGTRKSTTRTRSSRTRSSLLDEIIDLNASATRFNQQVLATVFGVLSDVLDASNDHARPGARRARRSDVDSDDLESEEHGVETRARDAIQSGLSELSDGFDRAASSMRRRSSP